MATKTLTPEQKERNAAYGRAYRSANREKEAARNRAYRLANPEKEAAYNRAWRLANLEKARARDRASARKRYAANPEEFKARARATHHKLRAENPEKYLAAKRKRRGLPESTRPCPKFCECCGKSEKKRELSLDHCHKTGKFRGWLCNNCNTGLGRFGDSLSGLLMAVEYLRKTG